MRPTRCALLFRQSPQRFSIARTVDSDATALLSFEGPEPLAFSRDVSLALARRTTTGPVPPRPIRPRPEIGPPFDTDLTRTDTRGPGRGRERLIAAAVGWLAAFEWIEDRLIGPPLPRGLELVQRIVTVEATRALLERVEYRIVARADGPGERGSVEAVLDRRRPAHIGGPPRLELGELLLVGADGPVLPPIRPPFQWPPRPAVFVSQPIASCSRMPTRRVVW